jgi:lysozyme
MRAIPRKAVNFVSKWEGFEPKAYLCPANVWTIGYGSTQGVKPGDTITKAQALTLLAKDMEVARAKLYGVIKPQIIDELTENQWSALLSFAFNLGAGKWQIWKRINARQFDQVPQELAKFVNAGGKKISGLVKRRAAEQVLWSTDEPGSTDEAVPSSVTRGVGVTPPTPADPAPASKSSTIITGFVGAAATVPVAAQQVTAAVAPYADQSEIVQKVIAALATIAAAAAVLVLVLTWIKKREARR